MPPTVRAVLALALLTAAGTAGADDPDPIVVRVGPASLRASEVARRLSLVPSYQLRALGETPDAARRRFVDTVLVRELLLASEADRRGLGETPSVKNRVREALRRGLADSMGAEARASGVPEDEIRAYYDANRDTFHQPTRIRIWRILVDDEALARRILSESRGTAGPEQWGKLAREHSVDEATKLRDGLLGFVRPDGTTDVPQVRVDPALYAAASKVKDGELVPGPVREQGRSAVVWRRGTLAETSLSLASQHDAIRDLILRERVERAVVRLREELRQRDVRDENAELITALPLPDAALALPTPRVLGPAASASPTPRAGERGLR